MSNVRRSAMTSRGPVRHFSRRASAVVTGSANAVAAVAGALGGAAVNGVIGGLQGTAAGVKKGAEGGVHSTPAAALTLAVIGALGLIEWPVLVAVGGTALGVRELTRQSPAAKPQSRPATAEVSSPSAGSPAPTPRSGSSTKTARAE
jgi:hypothetical protein